MAVDNLSLYPFDVSGTLVRESNASPWTLMNWLQSGGFFVWPILALGALGLLLVVERCWTLSVNWKPTIVRVRGRLANTTTTSASERESLIEAALLAEEPRLERSLTLLAAVAGIAPLLGLLGTVTGLMDIFDVISGEGSGDPRKLSGGISVALITTQIGLIVAVPALLAHAFFSRLVERREAALEAMVDEASGAQPQGGSP